MQTNPSQLPELLERWMSGQASEAEKEAFFELLDRQGADALAPHLRDAWEQLRPGPVMTDETKDAIADRILHRPQSAPVWRLGWWYAAAAMLALAIAIPFGYQYWKAKQPAGVAVNGPHDVAPGKEGAILTLAGGRQIILDSLGNGLVASQQGTRITLQNGSLAYDAADASEITFNTMTTPRGRKFQLVLPDGTKVWLNAASSLRFPTAFSGAERRVEMTGEAYFEVAKDAKHPFFVSIGDGTDVQALGTAFNIHAYEDEPHIQATLLEGSVRVRNATGSRVLVPGQQARIVQGGAMTVLQPDLEQVTAWKSGVFLFQGAPLRDVMRQLARWYDIDVIYEGNVPDQIFEGELPQSLQLSQVTRILTKVNIKFRIEEGKRLIVLP
ncbi:FecR family protein [Chitinophaga sp. NPDC101104]|uniref:FecR family protein n=1 Tax=Chitinophaga sp. NPDC101104 TaxID=3390561 RepID=UPI003D04FC45